MTNKVLGIVIVLLGLALLFRLFVSGTVLFLIIAGVLALAAGTGHIGRLGYVLAGIFAVLAFAGFATRGAIMAIGMLFKMAPLLLVLVGIYLLARAIRK